MGNIYASCFLAVCLILASICLNIHQLLLFSNACINTGICCWPYILIFLVLNHFFVPFGLLIIFKIQQITSASFLFDANYPLLHVHTCMCVYPCTALTGRKTVLKFIRLPCLDERVSTLSYISYLNSKWVISFLNLIFIKR